MIVCATLFLVALFVVRNGNPFKEKTALQKLNEDRGLIYNGATVADLVENDADGDGVADWEEALWDLDPTKRETTPGIPDGTAFAKMKAAYEPEGGESYDEASLTETDKFSRELLSSLVALNQNGAIDDTTIEKISASLADHLKNSPQRKIYLLSDLKITTDDSAASYKKFNIALENLDKKIPMTGNVSAVLDEFVVDQNTVDPAALSKLNPIIVQLKARLAEALKIEVPQSLSSQYLTLLNASQGLAESLTDIQSYESDPMVTLGAIAKYEQNITLLAESVIGLTKKINQKISY